MSKAPSRFAPIAERLAHGRSLRAVVRRVDQDVWRVGAGRPAIVDVLRKTNTGRIEDLVPIKYGRMAESPFAFFRGSGPIMAMDLVTLPSTQHTVQICGDAHVRNLGAFASADGRIVFDVNDFDETCTAPWEWVDFPEPPLSATTAIIDAMAIS